MTYERNPQRPVAGTAGENNRADSSTEKPNVNGQHRLATASDDLSWLLCGRYLDLAPEWEPVAEGSGIALTALGHLNIHCWRLAVPGGHIYKVTERDEAGVRLQICFVPELKQ
jgi:hypothetical protein